MRHTYTSAASERAEDLAHAATCAAAPSLPPPPKPRWNALLGRRV